MWGVGGQGEKGEKGAKGAKERKEDSLSPSRPVMGAELRTLSLGRAAIQGSIPPSNRSV